MDLIHLAGSRWSIVLCFGVLLGAWSATGHGAEGDSPSAPPSARDALAQLDGAITADTTDPALLVGRGQARMERGEFRAAIADFDKALSLGADARQTDLAFTKRLDCYVELGNTSEALSPYTRQIGTEPQNPEPLYRRALAASYLANRSKLRLNLDEPTFVLKWNLNEQAVADLNKAIALKPDHYDALRLRAGLLLQTNYHAKAIADLDVLIRHDANNADDFCNRARAHWGQRQFKEGLEDCAQALKLRPDYPHAFAVRGLIATSQGRYDEAIKDFDRAVGLQPDYDWACLYRAHCRFYKGDYKGAVGDYTRAIAINPQSTESLMNRATCYQQLGQLEDARNDYSAMIRLKPHQWIGYRGRGQVALLLNRPADAIEDLHVAVEMIQRTMREESLRKYKERDLGPALAARGQAHYRLGHFQQALEDVSAAMALRDGGQQDLIRSRCYVNLALGRYAEAAEDARTAVKHFTWGTSQAAECAALGYLAERRANHADAAEAILKDMVENGRKSSVFLQGVRHLRGEVPAEELLQKAGSPVEETTLRYYAAMHLVLDGQVAQALAQLEWIIKNAPAQREERELAQVELQRLEKAKP